MCFLHFELNAVESIKKFTLYGMHISVLLFHKLCVLTNPDVTRHTAKAEEPAAAAALAQREPRAAAATLDRLASLSLGARASSSTHPRHAHHDFRTSPHAAEVHLGNFLT